MTTIAERKKIAKLVLTINDDNVLTKIKSILSVASKTARENYIKQYNKEIDEADARIERGEFYTGEQANALLAKWQKRGISWDKKAWQEFINILEYIREDSPDNAIKVGNRVSNVINLIPEHPEMFKQDDLKVLNDGSFRVFVQDRIRVTYRIKPDGIRIERVRHTSQEPTEY